MLTRIIKYLVFA